MKLDYSVIQFFLYKLHSSKRTLYKEIASELPRRNISDKNDVIKACNDVLRTRIFLACRQKNRPKNNIDIKIESIGKSIYKYYNGKLYKNFSQKRFDVLHNKLCYDFLKCYSPSLSYGNAQKFINMTFKYLMCYQDYRKYADAFIYCHMPIDRIILRRLSKCLGICEVKQYRFNNHPWTKFNKPTYVKLFKRYRKAFGSKLKINKNWLALEFLLYSGFCIKDFDKYLK